jgi:hypothetical protein
VSLAICGVLLAVAALGAFVMRPSPLLGVDGRSLESSVGNGSSLFGFQLEPCTEKGGEWRCSRWDDQMSSTVGYRVDVDGAGCWHATRIGPPGEGSDKRLSGCLWLFDYL